MIQLRSLSATMMVVAAAWLHAGAASAQGPPAPRSGAPSTLEPSTAAPPAAPAPVVALPRLDRGGTVGWFSQKIGDAQCCPWYHDSLWAGVEGGYYWTEHLKTEAGFAATTDGQTYFGDVPVAIGGVLYAGWSETRVRTRRLTAAQLYQFGHNAWVHPFVGAGVSVVREDRRESRMVYPIGVYPNVSGHTELVTTSETVLRGSALVGMKAYLAKRAYFRTDLVLGFRKGVDEVILRCGFGVDF
jgi:hypothetical protein